jgi:magnesium chelatase subunit D
MSVRGFLTLPFDAIVGQDELKLGLLLNVVNPRIGGLLVRGAKGTGKSTAVHALAEVLPPVEIVADCPFRCSVVDEANRCESCRRRFESGEKVPAKSVAMEVITLPLSITEDRLIGSIDVERILHDGQKAFQPGLLAEANQNILYVDEVNLLPDHVTDDLLDVTALGWNSVEREGFSVTHPSRFVFVGSMNPEEGELRPQILDRFPLSTLIQTISDEEQRVQIIRNNLEFEKDPLGFRRKFEDSAGRLKTKISQARLLLPRIRADEPIFRVAASICAKLKVDGQRPDIVISKSACAAAALDGRTMVNPQDILKASQLTLSHRTREGGFEPPATREEIQQAYDESLGKWAHLWKEKGGLEAPAPGGELIAGAEGDLDVKKKP